jgi:hypothetical protein
VRTRLNILNFINFQTGWFVCVLYPVWQTAGVIMVLLMLHFSVVSRHRLAELKFIMLGTVAGSALDLLWLQSGVLADGYQGWLPPLWLIALWAMFMTTLSHSLSWIGQYRWLPYVFAPIAGPFTYWSASELGAVNLPYLPFSLLALAAGWLVLFPALLYLKKSRFPVLAS